MGLAYWIKLNKQKKAQKEKHNKILYQKNPDIKNITICTRIAFGYTKNCLSCNDRDEKCNDYIKQYPEIEKRLSAKPLKNNKVIHFNRWGQKNEKNNGI